MRKQNDEEGEREQLEKARLEKEEILSSFKARQNSPKRINQFHYFDVVEP